MEQRFGFFSQQALQRAATVRRAVWQGVKSLACLAVVACCLAACRPRTAAFAYENAPVDGWQPIDTLHFSVDSLREGGNYLLTLGVRTSTIVAYPYRSITLRVHQCWHQPDTAFCDTVCVRLVDGRGNREGRGITLYQVEQPFARHAFQTGQRAEITVTHLMRSGLLQGIESVGLRVEKE